MTVLRKKKTITPACTTVGSLSAFLPQDKNEAGTAIIAMAKIVTPLGEMVAEASADGICLLEFADRLELKKQYVSKPPGGNKHLDKLRRELDLYFAGRLRVFTVRLDICGSEFQKKAWQVLQKIPYGRTRSYKEQAALIGRKNAVRAIGHANGANPIAIVIPCHRVIGADGRLTGYGSGLWRKRFLLDLERKKIK